MGAVPWAQTPEEYLQQSDQLVREFRWREAVTVLERGVGEHPGHARLQLELGALLSRMGRSEEADRLLDSALSLVPSDPTALLQRARAYLRRGQARHALPLLRKGLWYAPQDARFQQELAYALLLEGRLQEALQHSRQAVQLAPSEPDFRRFHALLLELDGRPEESYQELRAAQKLLPGDAHLLFQLAEKQRPRGHRGQALEFLESATALDPENPLYRERLAEVYEELGLEDLARQQRERAAALQQAFERYAAALQKVLAGGLLKAVGILGPTVEANPEFQTGALLLASLYQRLGNPEAALRLYFRVLERHPGEKTAIDQSAWILAQNGQLSGAVELLEGFPADSPNRRLLTGYRHLLEGNWQAALEDFRAVETSHPLHTPLLQLIGFCLNALGQEKEALFYLEKARLLRPSSSEILEQIRETRLESAFRLQEQGRWKEALAILEPLRKELGNRADVLLYSAYCRQQLGQNAEAIEEYRRGLQRHPQASWARANLASLLFSLGLYSEAASHWEILAREGASPEVFYNLGLAKIHQQRIPEGKEWLRRSAAAGYRRAALLLKQYERW